VLLGVCVLLYRKGEGRKEARRQRRRREEVDKAAQVVRADFSQCSHLIVTRKLCLFMRSQTSALGSVKANGRPHVEAQCVGLSLKEQIAEWR